MQMLSIGGENATEPSVRGSNGMAGSSSRLGQSPHAKIAFPSSRSFRRDRNEELAVGRKRDRIPHLPALSRHARTITHRLPRLCVPESEASGHARQQPAAIRGEQDRASCPAATALPATSPCSKASRRYRGRWPGVWYAARRTKWWPGFRSVATSFPEAVSRTMILSAE